MKRTPLLATLILIPFTVVLRFVSAVRYSAAVIDWFSLAVAGLLVLLLALLLLSGWGKTQSTSLPNGKKVTIAAILLALCGASLMLYNLAEALQLMAVNTAYSVPYSTQSADRFLLTLQSICGIGGGVFLLYVGMRWWREKRCVTPIGKGLALLPVLWGWFRLARYVISYESAIGIHNTIYDYAHLIFSLLFLMMLAHLLSGTRSIQQSNWITIALPAAWFGLSGLITTLVLWLLQEQALQREILIGNSFCFVDLPLAVTALFMAANALKPAEPIPAPEQNEMISEETVVPTEPETPVFEEEPQPHAKTELQDENAVLSHVLQQSEKNKSLDTLLREIASNEETESTPSQESL